MNIVAQLFKIIIESFYKLTGDYGIAIVMVTLVIRTCLVPLNIKNRRGLKKREEMSKEVEALRNKCGNDQKKLNTELQKLYAQKGSGVGSCLLPFLQIPIMCGLYSAIQIVSLAGTGTILLPWVASILVKDTMLILPIATILVQIIPYFYPYFHLFKTLNIQKTPFLTILFLSLFNSLFVFLFPTGVGLYYFVSGLFTATEEFVVNLTKLHKQKEVCTA